MAPTNHTKDSVRRYFDLIWNEGRVELVGDFIAADYVGHDQTEGAVTERPDGIRALVLRSRETFPDLRVDINDGLAEDDLVAIRWTASGTGSSGAPVEWSGISVFRLLAGKQVESWTQWDGLRALDGSQPGSPAYTTLDQIVQSASPTRSGSGGSPSPPKESRR
jgi:predicted ester cyclase